MQVWRNCQVLSEQTSDSSAILNSIFLVKYVNCEQHLSFFIIRFGLTVTVFARFYSKWIRLQAVPISIGQITGATFEGMWRAQSIEPTAAMHQLEELRFRNQPPHSSEYNHFDSTPRSVCTVDYFSGVSNTFHYWITLTVVLHWSYCAIFYSDCRSVTLKFFSRGLFQSRLCLASKILQLVPR
jgi:hypothetical protein